MREGLVARGSNERKGLSTSAPPAEDRTSGLAPRVARSESADSRQIAPQHEDVMAGGCAVLAAAVSVGGLGSVVALVAVTLGVLAL